MGKDLNTDVFQQVLFEVGGPFVKAVPTIVAAAVVFLIGIAAAFVLQRVVERIFILLRADELARRFEVSQAVERYGIHLRVGAVFGWIVKWFLVIVALVAATDILGWNQVTDYLKQVALYVPNVVIAVLIVLIGLAVATAVRRVVRFAAEAGHLASPDLLSGLARWAILLFTFLAALNQLRIAEQLVQILFMGFVLMFALAGGIAFGLGGRDYAGRLLDRLERGSSSDQPPS